MEKKDSLIENALIPRRNAVFTILPSFNLTESLAKTKYYSAILMQNLTPSIPLLRKWLLLGGLLPVLD